MDRKTLVLAANGEQAFEFTGSFIRVESATGAVELRAENPRRGRVLTDALQVVAGNWVRTPERFTVLRVKNLTGATNNVVLVIGDGEVGSDVISGSVSISNPVGTTYDSTADVILADASSHDIAADTTRRELHLEADDGNSGNLRIRDQAGTTSEGPQLRPGQLKVIATTAAVRIRNNSGAAQTFAIAEVKG